MTEQELRDLAARASTLRERLGGGFVAAGLDDRVMREAAQARLAAWGQAAAAGNTELFAALLARDELDEAAALPLLGCVRLAHGQPLPEWAAAFAGIAAALSQAVASAPPEETVPLPFAELLWPAILAADERLAERTGAALPALFAPPARAGLCWLLLRRLSAYCAPALFWEFSAFRSYGSGRLPAASAEAGTGAPRRRIYDAFVADWRRHSHEFFTARPVLARIVATAGLDAARQIGETLARGAIRSDGSAAWIGTVLLDHDHSTLGVCGPDLCSGSAGIALFLAALARATRDAHFRDLAEAALRPVRVMLGAADGGAKAARTLGLGAGSGIASIIYVLSHLSRLLHDPHLLSGARGLARLIDPDLIAADRSYDALAGAAGAILVLLTLHRATEDPADLERAVICGRHLLRRQVTDGPAAAWPTLPRKAALPIGMAHGTAGIALALLRLYERTGEENFRAAGAAALAHERRGFIASASNWPMTPDSERGILLCQWCYGAPGIGLSRLAMLDLIDDPDLPGEIDAAIRTTLAASPAYLDHPCCGNCGQIEFLLSAGRRLERPELIAAARARLGALLDGWTARGGFGLPNSDDGFNPGFFQGISGIGYTILRVARPAPFPNVLIWE